MSGRAIRREHMRQAAVVRRRRRLVAAHRNRQRYSQLKALYQGAGVKLRSRSASSEVAA